MDCYQKSNPKLQINLSSLNALECQRRVHFRGTFKCYRKQKSKELAPESLYFLLPSPCNFAVVSFLTLPWQLLTSEEKTNKQTRPLCEV